MSWSMDSTNVSSSMGMLSRTVPGKSHKNLLLDVSKTRTVFFFSVSVSASISTEAFCATTSDRMIASCTLRPVRACVPTRLMTSSAPACRSFDQVPCGSCSPPSDTDFSSGYTRTAKIGGAFWAASRTAQHSMPGWTSAPRQTTRVALELVGIAAGNSGCSTSALVFTSAKPRRRNSSGSAASSGWARTRLSVAALVPNAERAPVTCSLRCSSEAPKSLCRMRHPDGWVSLSGGSKKSSSMWRPPCAPLRWRDGQAGA
mmetsp:Transcript_96163/g.267180  ORF Transcript_96163/g.267180 Transcript_96163/m.267180 type:complete len:258 (+) Transcript_96163:1021-1794(+)